MESGKWNSVNITIIGMVKPVTYVLKTQEPYMCSCTSSIRNTIFRILDGLVPSFSWVLVVLVRFTLPTVNTKGTKDIFYFFTKNTLSLRRRLGAPH
jgi:hypothetical protein